MNATTESTLTVTVAKAIFSLSEAIKKSGFLIAQILAAMWSLLAPVFVIAETCLIVID